MMAMYEVRLELEGYPLTVEMDIPYKDPTEQDIYNWIMDAIVLEWDMVED
jgi:hypothetical protein